MLLGVCVCVCVDPCLLVLRDYAWLGAQELVIMARNQLCAGAKTGVACVQGCQALKMPVILNL